MHGHHALPAKGQTCRTRNTGVLRSVLAICFQTILVLLLGVILIGARILCILCRPKQSARRKRHQQLSSQNCKQNKKHCWKQHASKCMAIDHVEHSQITTISSNASPCGVDALYAPSVESWTASSDPSDTRKCVYKRCRMSLPPHQQTVRPPTLAVPTEQQDRDALRQLEVEEQRQRWYWRWSQ